MSQANVEIVKGMVERFAAGDRSSWREVIAEDAIWDTSATITTSAGVYEGHEGVERFFVDWLGTWDDPRIEHREFIDAGDSVVVVFRWWGRGKSSGVPVERDFFGVHDLRDGKVVRFRQYDTRAEALEAAGLTE